MVHSEVFCLFNLLLIQEKIEEQIRKLAKIDGNKVCVDCPEKVGRICRLVIYRTNKFAHAVDACVH